MKCSALFWMLTWGLLPAAVSAQVGVPIPRIGVGATMRPFLPQNGSLLLYPTPGAYNPGYPSAPGYNPNSNPIYPGYNPGYNPGYTPGYAPVLPGGGTLGPNQFGGGLPGGGFNNGGFQGGGLNGGRPFQSGLLPGGTQGLPPGGARTLAAYCTDLMSDAPDGSVRLLADVGKGEVQVGAFQMPILDAEQQGLLLIRGHDSTLDPPRQDGGQWLDFHLVNLTNSQMTVRVDPGTVFTPQGQNRPQTDPHINTLLALEDQQGLTTTNEACMSVWASRGSNFQDVAEQGFTFLPQSKAASVQQLLDKAGVHQTFSGGTEDYRRLYEKKLRSLGTAAHAIRLPLKLSDGTSAEGLLTRSAAGEGVVDVTPTRSPAGDKPHLYYSAHIIDSAGQFAVTLLQPKTGAPLPYVPDFTFKTPH